MLSFRLRAATFVLAGAWCIKLSLGAVQTPAAADSSPAADSPPVGGRTCRFLKMSTSSGMVTWGSKPQGKAVRADAESLSNGLSKHERACSLRIVLQVSFQYLSLLPPPWSLPESWEEKGDARRGQPPSLSTSRRIAAPECPYLGPSYETQGPESIGQVSQRCEGGVVLVPGTLPGLPSLSIRSCSALPCEYLPPSSSNVFQTPVCDS